MRSKLSWTLPSQIGGMGCSTFIIRLGRACFRHGGQHGFDFKRSVAGCECSAWQPIRLQGVGEAFRPKRLRLLAFELIGGGRLRCEFDGPSPPGPNKYW